MGVRVAELVGGLSLATDMGAGMPLQSALAGAVLATRMARKLGLPEERQRATYYTAILRFIGCTAMASESAQAGAGDDRSLMYALGMCDLTKPEEVAQALDRFWNRQADPAVRRDVIRAIAEDLSPIAQTAAQHCMQAVILSRRLPVGDDVPRLLGHMYDRFDGVMSSATGDDIPVEARLCNIAASTAIVSRSLGHDTALDIARARKGGQFCPECVDLLVTDGATLCDGLDAPSCWNAFLDTEPGVPASIGGSDLERACTAYADYADQKAAFLLGHSRHVAQSTFLGATALDLDAETRDTLRLAALLHDVGRAGVASGIWDKPGTLSAHERRLVESHNEHTETILRLAPSLRTLAAPASAVHERVDGSGYPASPLEDLGAGLLAAADVYNALTHDRPWRPAYTPEKAADLLLDEAKSGRLHRRAVGAVLDAAGHGTRTRAAAYPDGLTEREVEVLGLLAEGLGNKQIAKRLDMAPKTVENHLGHIYDKTGARGRAVAALYAVEHGLHL